MIDFDGLALGPCMDAFGEPVVFMSSKLTAPLTVNAIFDCAFQPVFPDDGTQILPTNITACDANLGVQLSRLGFEPEQGDLVTVRGKAYRVREVQLDGRGGALLPLMLDGGDNGSISG